MQSALLPYLEDLQIASTTLDAQFHHQDLQVPDRDWEFF
jgi:hypothetical protein